MTKQALEAAVQKITSSDELSAKEKYDLVSQTLSTATRLINSGAKLVDEEELADVTKGEKILLVCASEIGLQSKAGFEEGLCEFCHGPIYFVKPEGVMEGLEVTRWCIHCYRKKESRSNSSN